MICSLSTTSITQIIGNFYFCLLAADLGQREVLLELTKLIYYLLDTFLPFRSEILNYIQLVSGHFKVLVRSDLKYVSGDNKFTHVIHT